MQILGNLFNAVIFVSAVGSIFTLISLFVNYVLRCTLPLWFPLWGMILFCVPVLSPEVRFFSPERQDWVRGFYMAGSLWVCGCGVLLVWRLVRLLLAERALKSCQICGNERLNRIYSTCAAAVTGGKEPVLYCGTLDTPICVTGVIHPAVIMREGVIAQLTDLEAAAVFSHELTHVKRRHLLLERIYDCVCILNWMNPLVWAARRNFSLHCETDCDFHTMRILRGRVTKTEYASAILRLLEGASFPAAERGNGIGALDFLLTKGRLRRITARASKARDAVTAVMLAVLLGLMLVWSMGLSREHFYPYPAYHAGIECTAGYGE